MNKEFKLPDVGEGLTEADIVSWHVKPGDTVTINQILVEIETAKAVVELPSPYAGRVSALLADEGQTVDVGTPIITIDVPVAGEAPAAGATPGAAAAEPQQQPTAAPAAPPTPPTPQPPARQPVLVGYGVKPGSTSRRPRKSPPTRPGRYPATPSAPPNGGPIPPPLPSGINRTPANAPGPAAPSADGSPGGPGGDGGWEPPMPGVRGAGAPPIGGSPGGRPPGKNTAKPPVRRLARDLGIELGGLTGSGPEGSVTRDDVQRAAGEARDRSKSLSSENQADGRQPVADLGPGGPAAAEQRIPVRGVRKHTAAAMVASAFTAPHVTEFLQVDATETMAAVRRARELPEFAGVKVSPLLFVAKALLVAVRRNPMINSSWDEAAQEIVVKRRVNLGIAVAADRGLLVPNVKGAEALALADLARAIDSAGATARAGKSTPEDLAGGTITITNVGVFGVDAGTPILLPGEAAILAFGQIRDLPWVVDGAIAVRKVTTLSLSFDHRIVDGELGSAVLRDVGSMLEDPVRMLAWS
jgi:2-oxoisovalerate dehydrogenase E2 component (dihydrolipoyl transacylase)